MLLPRMDERQPLGGKGPGQAFSASERIPGHQLPTRHPDCERRARRLTGEEPVEVHGQVLADLPGDRVESRRRRFGADPA